MAVSHEQRYPEPTVGALIMNARGEMLLVKSPKWGDRLTVAGGHVEVGETMVEALRREIREEVGLEIGDIRFLLVQEAIFSREFFKRRHFIFFDFVCRAAGDPRIDGREIVGYEWVRPAMALKLNLESFTRRMIETYLAKPKTPRQTSRIHGRRKPDRAGSQTARRLG